MEQFIWETAEELDQKLAQRVRNIRKRRLISQEKLASLSGVSYGSIKRFEATGQISLISLTKIAMALDIADELRNIFTQVPFFYQSFFTSTEKTGIFTNKRLFFRSFWSVCRQSSG